MKALVVVTGRGLGGDAVVGYNLIDALEKKGVHCEIALDEFASGILFEKKGYTWHKITVPQAGGHAATKLSSFKAACKMLPASFKIRSLIKKLDVDFVVGVIGGGSVVASVGAKLTNTPCVTLCCTPLDMRVCPRLNHAILLPEYYLFREENLPDNLSKTYYPIEDNITSGNAEIALEKLKEYPLFDENKKTILFSSGSSLFKGMIEAANDFTGVIDDYNVVLIGYPMEDEYLELINEDKIIYLGFLDWLNHLYDFIDLAVLTDDGVMIEEVLACKVPIVTITKIKWGRYHNMEGLFKGAILETDMEDANETILHAFDIYDSLHEKVLIFSDIIINAKSDLADQIIDICGNKS